MQIVSTLLGPVIALVLFAAVVSGAFARHENNWSKLAFAIYGLALAVPATSSFSALQSASATELFSFVAYSLGVTAGALLPFQLKRGGWQVMGLLPQWEPEASAQKSMPVPAAGKPGA